MVLRWVIQAYNLRYVHVMKQIILFLRDKQIWRISAMFLRCLFVAVFYIINRFDWISLVDTKSDLFGAHDKKRKLLWRLIRTLLNRYFCPISVFEISIVWEVSKPSLWTDGKMLRRRLFVVSLHWEWDYFFRLIYNFYSYN